MNKIQKVLLYPCPGSPVRPRNHIYYVTEVVDGKTIDGVDFMTIKQAQDVYRGTKLEITESHRMCPECTIASDPETSLADLKAIYPNFRGKLEEYLRK